jgi:uncharacterized caspase-like protein
MGAKSITVFLDACYTGQTRSSQMLIADSRPIITQRKANVPPKNITVLSAASGSQISGAMKEKEHGLFTYYLLKGLAGQADTDNDKAISIRELHHFLATNVKDAAALDGREQNPQLLGNGDQTLVRHQ